MFGRQKVAALVAEFLGVAVLSSAVLAMDVGRTPFPFYYAMIAGLVLGLMVLVVGPISGAHLNPIVTIGLWTTRKVRTTQALVYVAAQALGGLAAWQLNEYLLNQPINSRAGDSLNWRVLIAEATGALVFTMALSAAISRSYTGAKLAVTAGVGLMVGMLVASMSAFGVINPALAIGIQTWSWAYVLGPLLGGIIGINLYGLLFAPLDIVKPRGARATVVAAVKKTRAKAKVARKRVTKKKK